MKQGEQQESHNAACCVCNQIGDIRGTDGKKILDNLIEQAEAKNRKHFLGKGPVRFQHAQIKPHGDKDDQVVENLIRVDGSVGHHRGPEGDEVDRTEVP